MFWTSHPDQVCVQEGGTIPSMFYTNYITCETVTQVSPYKIIDAEAI